MLFSMRSFFEGCNPSLYFWFNPFLANPPFFKKIIIYLCKTSKSLLAKFFVLPFKAIFLTRKHCFLRKVIVNTFGMSNINYCSLVWNFISAQSSSKIEKPTQMSFTLLVERLWQHLWRSARKIWYKYEFKKT